MIVLQTISSFYTNALHPGFDSFITALSTSHFAIYLLIAGVVILWIVRSNINILSLEKIIGFFIGIIVILIFIVAYNTFSPEIFKIFKSQPTSELQNSTSSGGVKQIYYSASCSSCYAQSCPLNGYKYDGPDLGQYTDIVSQCKSCACTSSKAQTLWR